MQHHYGGTEAGRGPSVWILFLLLFALMGLSLVHEPETPTAGARAGPPWNPGTAAGLDREVVAPEAREKSQEEVKTDGGP